MTPKSYNDEFKASAARLVREQGYSVSRAAQSLGVDPGSIRRWVHAFSGPVAMPDASAEELRRENIRLREENRRLLMERDILKKATAFFAKESS